MQIFFRHRFLAVCFSLEIRQGLRGETFQSRRDYDTNGASGLFSRALSFNRTGYEARQTSVEQAKMPRFMWEGPRP